MIEHDDGYDPYNSATTRKAPPIPDWLRNDPELERVARIVVTSLPGWRFGGDWTPEELARYRKG